ncbi:MAG: acetyl-CoA C-acyltransferase [Alphaproteobacteria bacterium CG11_big_fil_rev_8_21_14_0_20_39_49]|nr:MAG: acetyl-CoA C-acyltransferase [Alphaproteobacteria bacterium CG11_big_fil_rev_8_21_14_0_20_39_49]
MKNAVIAGYVRSPFTPAHKGEMADIRPDEIAAQVIKALVERTGVKATDIEDLIMGCAFPEGEQGLNVSRLVSFIAGLPISVAGQTVNRFCGSSMQTVHIAAANIAAGMGEVFIAAGMESMTRVPMTGFNPLPHPDLYERYPEAYESMGVTAENLANKYNIKRKAQEQFAVESHKKAYKAAESGKFNNEIINIVYGGKTVSKDGCIRPETTVEKLEELRPAFDSKGTVTAGTSSPLTDGAVALLICSEEYAGKNGLKPIARIKSFAVSGCAPEIMGIGPVNATKKALQRAGLELKDIDVIELNEAFAAQAIAVIKELNIDTEKLNLDGGAIALGHPLGASGGRIVGKAAGLLKRKKGKYALATMCIGGGQGIATILEAI